MNDKFYNTRDEYYQDHQVCPECGEHTSSTYMGYVFSSGRSFRDENNCTCECGWCGITDDLVKEN